MKRYYLFLILVLVSSSCFAWGEEKICGVKQINTQTCQKGDVLVMANNNGKGIGLFCDFSKAVVTINNTGFVCYYIGYTRDERE